MPTLNLDLAFFSHPKVIRLTGRCGPGAELHLLRLWCYCGTHCPETGELDMTADEVEAVCAWTGPKGKLVSALLSVHLLHKAISGYSVHDWKEHAGHLVAYKKRAKLASATRWNGLNKTYDNASSNASSNANGKSKQSPMQCSAVQCSADTDKRLPASQPERLKDSDKQENSDLPDLDIELEIP